MEDTLTTSILNVIGSLGFPIAITFYFLSTLNKTLKNQTEVLQALKTLIEKHFEKP